MQQIRKSAFTRKAKIMHSYEYYKDQVDQHLCDFIHEDAYNKTLVESMKYSLETGGKRLRPVLLLAASEFAGVDLSDAMIYACAVEYIHTYSLIHDDLPAMDNDDLRRGHPTNHKVYGDAIAILAGDGLLNTAAELLTAAPLRYIKDVNKMAGLVMASNTIMHSSGISGMIGGQVADVENEFNEASPELVEYIELHKTADLITAPIVSGLLLGNAPAFFIENFKKYGTNLGVAFQILDDILDFEGDAELVGKNVGKDKDLGKCNYACVHGLDAAKEKLHELTNEAKSAIEEYGEDVEFFIELADQLENRKA